MRVVLLGGTRFIGRAILEELLAAGHEVLLVHRGEHEPRGLPQVPHLHAHRQKLPRERLREFRPDAAVDVSAMTFADAQAVLEALPEGLRLVVCSSMDVYRAFLSVWRQIETDPVPLTEESPVRDGPVPLPPAGLPGWDFDLKAYEKLDVERLYLERGGIVLRLPVVYGEHDYLRREELVLRRVRSGRKRMPAGAAKSLFTRGYVRDMGSGVRLALEADLRAEVLNLAESSTWSIGLWMRRIAVAAGAEMEFVRVPDEKLPPDLAITGTLSQHLLVDSSKARRLLGWRDTEPEQALLRSVRWHLEHPPEDAGDFSADDRALSG